jgi:flavin-dependent dehydrogenase
MPVAIHLDRFTRSIFAQALKAGVEFYSGYKAVAPLCTAQRVCGARFETPDGTADVKARLVIAATGFSAALIRKLPAAFDMRFMESGSDIVSAANRFYSIDPETAAAAADRGIHGAEEGWNRLGRTGCLFDILLMPFSQKRQSVCPDRMQKRL